MIFSRTKYQGMPRWKNMSHLTWFILMVENFKSSIFPTNLTSIFIHNTHEILAINHVFKDLDSDSEKGKQSWNEVQRISDCHYLCLSGKCIDICLICPAESAVSWLSSRDRDSAHHSPVSQSPQVSARPVTPRKIETTLDYSALLTTTDCLKSLDPNLSLKCPCLTFYQQ